MPLVTSLADEVSRNMATKHQARGSGFRGKKLFLFKAWLALFHVKRS